jgi:hypothetical protein
MVDRGRVFTARDMLRVLARRAYEEFVHTRPWGEGVPGFLRAGILLAFYFYVWPAFWQLSGARRTPEDDALTRQVGSVVEAARMPVRIGRRLARFAGKHWPD